MSKVYTDPANYEAIADAIRYKLDNEETYKPSEMASAIRSIVTEPTINSLTITQNGTYTAPEGVDGYSPVNVNVASGDKNANIHWHMPKICKGDPQVTVHSDCELDETLNLNDYQYSTNITNLNKTSSLDILLTLDRDNMNIGDLVTFSSNYTCYLFDNGTADAINKAVMALDASDTYETTGLKAYRRDVLSRMIVVRNNSYMDTGTDTCSFTNSFPRVGFGSSDITSVSVNADSYVNAGNLTININQRDAASYYVWKEEGDCSNFHFIKVRWKGASHYSIGIDQEWEVVMLSNGDVILRVIKKGSYSGNYNFYGIPYSINDDSLMCFYRKDYYGTQWDLISEEYNLNHHYYQADSQCVSTNFASVAGLVDQGTLLINNVAYDDNDYSYSFICDFAWHDKTSLTASGNSWMGIGGASEDVRMHRRDAKMYYLYFRNYELTDLNNLKALYTSWKGSSHYNIAIDRWWSLWLFENGDAMIYISTVGSNTGTCSFFNQSFNGSDNSYISFYYNSSSSNYDIRYERYTLEHHIG